MAIYRHENTSIYYEDSGEDLPALLLIAPGGMKSALSFWKGTPWDPREQLKGRYRIIAMDQRNACLLYTSPRPRDQRGARMPSSA